MATGGAADNRTRFTLPVSGITVIVTEGDIMETGAEAIATGEDFGLEGRGGVTQLLLKKCPKAYKSARDKLKKDTKKFEFGKVYACNFPNPVTGGKKAVSFNTVFHAIVPSVKVVSDHTKWKDQMVNLYYNLFKAANAHAKTSLALPLLGSGGAGAKVDVAVDALTVSLMSFSPDRVATSLLKGIIVYARKETFSKMVARMREKQKSLPARNGMVSHTLDRSGHGSGRPGTPSSSSWQKNAYPSSGKGSSRNPCRSSDRPKASGSALGTQRQVPDDMSNLIFILQDTTLDRSQHDRACQQQDEDEEEEDMDCDDFELVEHKDTSGHDEEETEPKEEKCAICLDVMDNPKKLEKCGHIFCTDCIEDSFKHHKPACPTCNTLYDILTGNQPRGTMQAVRCSDSLPGYQNCGQIVIDYDFPSGIQGKEHPNPGQPYRGTARRAFLPDCPEGRKVYRLLRVAFDYRLTFTVGRSVTTGQDNVVTWNDIHHKTRPLGGVTGFGYPDPNYLSRVQEELAAKGVTEESLQGRNFDI